MTNDKNNKFTLPSANVSFPSQSDPFELKRTTEWGLNLAQQIQSEWFYGFNTGNFLNSQFNTQRRDFLERRIYAKGLQSMDKYMAEFKPDGDKSFLNLSKQPICVIPKLP